MDNDIISLFYFIFAVVYTFKVWGVFWGIVSLFFPVFPMIDFAVFIVQHLR